MEPRRPSFLVPLFPIASDNEEIVVVTTDRIRCMVDKLPVLFSGFEIIRALIPGTEDTVEMLDVLEPEVGTRTLFMQHCP